MTPVDSLAPAQDKMTSKDSYDPEHWPGPAFPESDQSIEEQGWTGGNYFNCPLLIISFSSNKKHIDFIAIILLRCITFLKKDPFAARQYKYIFICGCFFPFACLCVHLIVCVLHG